mgnify:CR=1 FL=1
MDENDEHDIESIEIRKREIQLRTEIVEVEFAICQMVSDLINESWNSYSMKCRLEEMKYSRELLYQELDIVDPVKGQTD